MLTFTAYGTPAPQGSTRAFMPRGARHPVVTADCKRTKPWRQAVTAACRAALRGHPPFEGPVWLTVTFYLPRPKSAPRRIVHPAKLPDLDKLVRAVSDALTDAGAWRDDGQVVQIVAGKVYAGGRWDLAGAAGVPRAEIQVR